ncbi:MAG: hypothetical protein IJ667_02640 [Synergistaceae bacterium]|nr:hypothetical protein [Synergistaceae bacterium]
MAQIVLNFSPELMRRIKFWSVKKRLKPELFLRKIIAEQIEDMDDYEIAAKISAEIDAGHMETYLWEDVKKELGLAY